MQYFNVTDISEESNRLNLYLKILTVKTESYTKRKQ